MSDKHPQAGWRIRIAFAMFVTSLAWPILIPLLPLFGASTAFTATISGTMIVVAEFLLIGGAAIAGKDGFEFIKSRVFGFLRSYGPPREVSRTRYRMGLIMFVLPIVFGWSSPYLAHHLPGFESGHLIYAISFDMLLLISLFLLGGGFWEKLKSLFVHKAYAIMPDPPAANRDAI